MGVALYFLDKLALRAGHEKDDDEADTVRVGVLSALRCWGRAVLCCAAPLRRCAPLQPPCAPLPNCSINAQVGCCTLKVENVECQPPNHLKFDFLGKDSIK